MLSSPQACTFVSEPVGCGFLSSTAYNVSLSVVANKWYSIFQERLMKIVKISGAILKIEKIIFIEIDCIQVYCIVKFLWMNMFKEEIKNTVALILEEETEAINYTSKLRSNS